MIVPLKSEASLRAFLENGHYSIGGEVGACLGPLGRNLAKESHGGASNKSLSHSKGFYVGAALSGGVVKIRSDINRNYYGQPVEPRQLFSGEIKPPLNAAILYDKLRLFRTWAVAPGMQSHSAQTDAGLGAEETV